ncbi:MAG: hypothetical protein ACREU5_11320 [Burkholderiales bacterium]
MSDHRQLHDTTASPAPPGDFRPADAIESLRDALLRVDTIAQVACDSADELRYPGDAAARRAFVRMQILVEQAADEASTALAQGDRLMAALTKSLQTQRDNQELGGRDGARARPAPAHHQKRSSRRARARGSRRL